VPTVHNVASDVVNLINEATPPAGPDSQPKREPRKIKAVELVPTVRQAMRWASEQFVERGITNVKQILEVENIAYDAVSFSLPTGFVHVYNIWERGDGTTENWKLMKYGPIPMNYEAGTNRCVYDFQTGVTLQVTIPSCTRATDFKVEGLKVLTVDASTMPDDDVDLIPFAYDAIVMYTAHLALRKPPSDLSLSREYLATAEDRIKVLANINTQQQQQRPMRPAPGFNSGFRYNRGQYQGGY